MIMSDGGPDFTPISVLNALYFYRLFKLLKLDILSVFSYAARYSAFNCIEHLWSPLSNKLAGVQFSPTLEGESKPPAHQGGLSKEELFNKEKKVFDKAILSIANDHWQGAKFDTFPVISHPVLCGEDNILYDDYDTVKAFLSCPIRDIHKHGSIKNEYVAMHQHLDRHLNEIVFTKCEDHTC